MNLLFFPLYPLLKGLIHYIRRKIFRIKLQIQENWASLKSTGCWHLKVNVISIQQTWPYVFQFLKPFQTAVCLEINGWCFQTTPTAGPEIWLHCGMTSSHFTSVLISHRSSQRLQGFCLQVFCIRLKGQDLTSNIFYANCVANWNVIHWKGLGKSSTSPSSSRLCDFA